MLMNRPIRIAAIGFGNRVRKYLQYLKQNPDKGYLTAVVESNLARLKQAQETFQLEDKYCFTNMDNFFACAQPVDAVIIGTPDHLHYEPCIKAIEKGYHVLLEKPIAQSLGECEKLLQCSLTQKVPVTVCYVLRYHPYYKKIKSIIDSKELGDMVSINHTINVGVDRTTHSYVRGIWNNTATSNPIILSKCCHDIDLINWLTNSKAKTVVSFGSLKWFRHENAPENSALRCIDCECEQSCPFSAIDLYMRRREWISNFLIPKGENLEQVLKKELEEGAYGKCVYHCNNDVVDHQVVSMCMENEIVVNLTMDCFTLKDNRITDIKFVFGEIYANDSHIAVTNFKTKKTQIYDFSEINKLPLHANADLAIMEEFLSSFEGSFTSNTPFLQSSIDSHKTCFAAEESRICHKIINL